MNEFSRHWSRITTDGMLNSTIGYIASNHQIMWSRSKYSICLEQLHDFNEMQLARMKR